MATRTCEAEVGSSKPLRVLDDVVDELGFGGAQANVVLLAGSGGFCAGAVKVMASLVAKSVGAEWGLQKVQQSSLVSVVFVGQGLGNCFFGILADKVGRRPPLVASFALTGFCAAGSALLATSFWSMLAWRAALGLSFGLLTTPFNALAGELCPSHRRIVMHVLGGYLFSLGIFYALTLVWFEDPEMQRLDWRRLTLLTALPSLLLALPAYIWLLESPRFLDRAGRRSEAVALLGRARVLNGRPNVDVDDWLTGEVAQDGGLATIFCPSLRRTTLILCFSTFVLNYCYYGALYALPQVLPEKQLYLSAAASMMVNALVEMLGLTIGMALDRHVSRRGGIAAYTVAILVCNLTFYGLLAAVPSSGSGSGGDSSMGAGVPAALLGAAMVGSQFAIAIGWVFIYLYSVEVYPTGCRASGSGVCVSVGRVGSALTPLAFEVLSAHPELGARAHFAVVGAMAGINAALVCLLPVETKDRQLGNIASETVPCSSAASPRKQYT